MKLGKMFYELITWLKQVQQWSHLVHLCPICSQDGVIWIFQSTYPMVHIFHPLEKSANKIYLLISKRLWERWVIYFEFKLFLSWMLVFCLASWFEHKSFRELIFLIFGQSLPLLTWGLRAVFNFKYCIIVIASLVHVLTHVLTIGTFYDMELIIRKEEKKKKRCMKPEVNCNIY